MTSFSPPASLLEIEISSKDHFFLWLIFSYILKRSAANKLASNPPVPALISIIAFFLSASSLGNKNNFNFFSFFSYSFCKSFSSVSAIFNNSVSEFWSSNIFFSSFLSFSNVIYFFATSIISFKSEYSFDFSAKSFLSIFPEDKSFSSNECLEINSSTVFCGIILFIF